MVYHGSSLQLPDAKDVARHLFIVKGQAWISDGSQDRTLGLGGAVTFRAEEPLRIENVGEDALYLLQVELKNPSG
jgi:mannose-6-phosphate isomerase-like protein (cupin superfamily)